MKIYNTVLKQRSPDFFFGPMMAQQTLLHCTEIQFAEFINFRIVHRNLLVQLVKWSLTFGTVKLVHRSMTAHRNAKIILICMKFGI